MSIIHIVLFKPKASLSDAQVQEFCDDMLALKTQCVHPDTKKTYIVSSSGGKDNSPEGIAGGFTHGFVVEFASASDRDYYIFEDPSHQVFIKKHTPSFDDVRVVDYEKGVF